MKRKVVHKTHISYQSKRKPSFVFSLVVLVIFFSAFFLLLGIVRYHPQTNVLGKQIHLQVK